MAVWGLGQDGQLVAKAHASKDQEEWQELFRKGVEGIDDIEEDDFRSQEAKDAFDALRRGALQGAHDDELMAEFASDCGPVLSFLIDYALRRKLYLRQVLEVVALLLSSPAWANVYMSLDYLQDRVKELPPNMQGAFALQSVHPAVARTWRFRSSYSGDLSGRDSCS
jgi:hypothetical protein